MRRVDCEILAPKALSSPAANPRKGENVNPRPPALGPAAAYAHDHPPVRDINRDLQQKMSPGQRLADRVASVVGSWPFIIIQSTILAAWIAVNVYLVVMEQLHPGYLRAWDPYPFILLNLMLSFQAAYTGPVVMMSQNRQSEKDRMMAQSDYEVNQKAEEEIEVVMKHLVHQDRLILDAIARLEALQATPPVEAAAVRIEEILRRIEVSDRRVVEALERRRGGADRAGA